MIDCIKSVSRREDLTVLFWTKVERPGPSDCWQWLGGVTNEGHAIATIWFEDEQRYRTKSASHVAIFLTYGYWPRRPVKRTCKNPLCVNLKHMKLD